LFEICSLSAGKHGVGSTRQAIRRGRSKFHYFDSEPLAAIIRR
jgi:hypothetical protein